MASLSPMFCCSEMTAQQHNIMQTELEQQIQALANQVRRDGMITGDQSGSQQPCYHCGLPAYLSDHCMVSIRQRKKRKNAPKENIHPTQ